MATFTGLIAKEQVVGTFGVLFGGVDVENSTQPIWAALSQDFTQLSAYSFLIFNLLCAPCFAAMGAIKREMNSAKWTMGAIGYMCGFAYAISMIVYQLGLLFTGAGFSVGTVAAIAVLVFLIYMVVRKNKYNDNVLTVSSVAAATR